MSEYHRIEVSQLSGSAGYVTVATVADRRLQDQGVIQELGAELDSLIGDDQPKNILLNLSRVEFISSAALNRLISHQTRVKKAGGQLRLSSLKPHIAEVFALTRLNRHFQIHETDSAALGSY